MTAKEKAIELFNKYWKFCNELSHDKNKTLAELMAITCVDEILEALEYNTWQNKDRIRHYKEVKEKINKL